MRNYNLPIMENNMAPLVVGKNSEHQEETHGNLAGLIKRTDFPTVCELCGNEDLEYLGYGKYRCHKCSWETYDHYGKARNFIEENGPSTITELSNGTGLRRNQIKDLIEAGYLYLRSGRCILK